MSEVYKVEGPMGINTTVEPTQLDPNTWDNGHNMYFKDGVSSKVSGYEQGFGAAKVTPLTIVPLRDDDDLYYWWGYVGWSEEENKYKMYKITTSATDHKDVSPQLQDVPDWGGEFDYKWTSDTLNGVPYMVYGVPYKYNGTSIGENGEIIDESFEMFENIPRHDLEEDGDNLGAPRVRFKSIRTYRNYLIGMNFYTDDFGGGVANGFGPWNEGYNQNALWWSHYAVGKDIDVGWFDADPLKESGWNFLGGAGGPLVDGRVLRDSFILYRETAVWQMTYVGGVNIFAFKELFSDAGLLGLDCLLEVEGQHIVVGQSDVYIHNGVKKQSIADGIIRKQLYESIHPLYYNKVFIVGDYKNKQAWICVPEPHLTVEGECTKAFLYNWSNNTWSTRDIPNLTTSAYTLLDIAEDRIDWHPDYEGGPLRSDNNSSAPKFLPGDDTPYYCDTNPDEFARGSYKAGVTWAEADDRWIDSFFKYNPAEWGLVLGSSDGPIFTQTRESVFDGNNFTSYVQKSSIDLGERWVSKYVSRIHPLVRGGIVEIWGAVTMTLDEGAVWRKLGNFDPSKDLHLSTRMTGRFVSLRFIIPETSRAKIKGYWFEFDYIGRR